MSHWHMYAQFVCEMAYIMIIIVLGQSCNKFKQLYKTLLGIL